MCSLKFPVVAVAQLVESRIVIPAVVGSNPIRHPIIQQANPSIAFSNFPGTSACRGRMLFRHFLRPVSDSIRYDEQLKVNEQAQSGGSAAHASCSGCSSKGRSRTRLSSATGSKSPCCAARMALSAR